MAGCAASLSNLLVQCYGSASAAALAFTLTWNSLQIKRWIHDWLWLLCEPLLELYLPGEVLAVQPGAQLQVLDDAMTQDMLP